MPHPERYAIAAIVLSVFALLLFVEYFHASKTSNR